MDKQYVPADIAAVDDADAVICHAPVDHNGVEECKPKGNVEERLFKCRLVTRIEIDHGDKE